MLYVTHRNIFSGLLLALAMLWFSGCGLTKATKGGVRQISCTSQGEEEYDIASFGSTIYAYTAGCRECHYGNGQAPAFQNADVEKSHLMVITDGELPAITNKIAGGHNLHKLSNGLVGMQQSVAQYEALMDYYAAFCAAQLPSGSPTPTPPPPLQDDPGSMEPNRQFTAARQLTQSGETALSTTALTSRSFVMISGTSNPYNLVEIQADFQLYASTGNPTEVIMKNIRVRSPGGAVRIRNIRLTINGVHKWATLPNYANVDSTVAVSTTFATITTFPQTISMTQAQTIQISAQMDPGTVTEAQQFAATVAPILRNRCITCHATQVANYRFTNGTTDTDLRTLTLTKINKNNPAGSLLFLKAQLATNNGGVTHGGSATNKPLGNQNTEVQAINAWILRTP